MSEGWSATWQRAVKQACSDNGIPTKGSQVFKACYKTGLQHAADVTVEDAPNILRQLHIWHTEMLPVLAREALSRHRHEADEETVKQIYQAAFETVRQHLSNDGNNTSHIAEGEIKLARSLGEHVEDAIGEFLASMPVDGDPDTPAVALVKAEGGVTPPVTGVGSGEQQPLVKRAKQSVVAVSGVGRPFGEDVWQDAPVARYGKSVDEYMADDEYNGNVFSWERHEFLLQELFVGTRVKQHDGEARGGRRSKKKEGLFEYVPAKFLQYWMSKKKEQKVAQEAKDILGEYPGAEMDDSFEDAMEKEIIACSGLGQLEKTERLQEAVELRFGTNYFEMTHPFREKLHYLLNLKYFELVAMPFYENPGRPPWQASSVPEDGDCQFESERFTASSSVPTESGSDASATKPLHDFEAIEACLNDIDINTRRLGATIKMAQAYELPVDIADPEGAYGHMCHERAAANELQAIVQMNSSALLRSSSAASTVGLPDQNSQFAAAMGAGAGASDAPASTAAPTGLPVDEADLTNLMEKLKVTNNKLIETQTTTSEKHRNSNLAMSGWSGCYQPYTTETGVNLLPKMPWRASGVGDSISVITNFYPINLPRDKEDNLDVEVVHWHVDWEAGKNITMPKNFDRRHDILHEELSKPEEARRLGILEGGTFGYDGTSILSVVSGRNKVQDPSAKIPSVIISFGKSGKNFIELKRASVLSMNKIKKYFESGAVVPRQELQHLDVLLRYTSARTMLSVGKGFFPKESRAEALRSSKANLPLNLIDGFSQRIVTAKGIDGRGVTLLQLDHAVAPVVQPWIDGKENQDSVAHHLVGLRQNAAPGLSGWDNKLETDRQWKTLAKDLKGMKIDIIYHDQKAGRRVQFRGKKILGFDLSPKEYRFKFDGTIISVAEYYERHRGIRLRHDVDLPCIVTRKQRLGDDNEVVLGATVYPMELCFYQRQIAPSRMARRSKDVAENMIKQAAISPAERFKKNEAHLQQFKNDPVLKKMGITVENEPAKVSARLLPQSFIAYGNNVTKTPTTERNARKDDQLGGWEIFQRKRPSVKLSEVREQLTTEQWGVLLLTQDEGFRDDIANFVQTLMRTANDVGLSLGIPDMGKVRIARLDTQVLNNPQLLMNITTFNGASTGELLIRNGPFQDDATRTKFVICILPDRKRGKDNTDKYGVVKHVYDKQGIPSQCIDLGKITSRGKPLEPHKLDPYCTNVCLKINSKLGGINHQPTWNPQDEGPKLTEGGVGICDLSRTLSLVIGLDVHHAAPGSSQPSIAAAVGQFGLISDNVDKNQLTHMWTEVKRLPPRVESISGLGSMVGGILDRFMLVQRTEGSCKQNVLPSRLIVYRDGVGESMFPIIIREEIKAIREVCARYRVDKYRRPVEDLAGPHFHDLAQVTLQAVKAKGLIPVTKTMFGDSVLVGAWVHNEFFPEEPCPQTLSARHHLYVPGVGVIDNAALSVDVLSTVAAYQPKLTFTVVQKRTNARFARLDKDGRTLKNVFPGTVIDTHIVSPHNYDFFLVSHHALKGTARAIKYWVICDDIGFGPDEIQKLTYDLCHLYQRCARTVSCPAPVFYAHLAAYRARYYSEDRGMDGSDTASVSSAGSVDDIQSWGDGGGLHRSLQSIPYFL